MGTDHYLACGRCCEFVALHKWAVLPRLYAPTYQDSSLQAKWRSSTVVPVWASELRSELDKSQEWAWIEQLRPLVSSFVDEHASHPLFLADDIGDLPWDIGEPDWSGWRYAGGCEDSQALLLPRNLASRFEHWEQVQDALRQECAWVLHPQLTESLEALREGFEREVARRAGGRRGG